MCVYVCGTVLSVGSTMVRTGSFGPSGVSGGCCIIVHQGVLYISYGKA